MRLQTVVQKPDDYEKVYDEAGRVTNPLPIVGMQMLDTGTTPQQTFSRDYVNRGVQQGWLSMGRGKITLSCTEADGTPQEDFVYTILRTPGGYCCFCNASIEIDQYGEIGKRHVAEFHDGLASPDPSNPLGFRLLGGYECELDADTHARWNAQAVATALRNGQKPGVQAGSAPAATNGHRQAGGPASEPPGQTPAPPTNGKD